MRKIILWLHLNNWPTLAKSLSVLQKHRDTQRMIHAGVTSKTKWNMPKLQVVHCWMISQDNSHMNLGNFKMPVARMLHWAAVPCGLDWTGAGQPGSSRSSPSPEHQLSPWGQWWPKARPGHGPMGGSGSVGPRARTVRAVSSWRLALLQCHCSSGWWSQGLRWVPGTWAGWSSPGDVGRGSEASECPQGPDTIVELGLSGQNE